MSDSERPNPPQPQLEVPDLELAPLPRSRRQSVRPQSAAPVRIEVDTAVDAGAREPLFGSSFELDDWADLERAAAPDSRASDSARQLFEGEAPPLVTGRALDPAKLELDAQAIARLAAYGAAPDNALRTPGYAYRVFVRRRELKGELASVAAECERAEHERESTLAELACALRPELEHRPELSRLFAPLLQVEQRAVARGGEQAALNEELAARNTELDQQLLQLASAIEAELCRESEARQCQEQCETSVKRAQAKLERVRIEKRALLTVAEQKLGSARGPVPEQAAAELESLEQRAAALSPGLSTTRAALAAAELALAQTRSRLSALRRAERQLAHEKQALGSAYRERLTARARGVSEAERDRRAALAELASALLGAGHELAIPELWRERVRAVSERADQLLVRRAMHERAISAYDARAAGQGLRLCGTAAILFFALLSFRLFF